MIEKSDSNALKIEKAVEKIKALGGERVKFIILYGSVSKNCQRHGSDIDICVYYDDESSASDFRLKVLSELFDDIYDIKIFQQLPLYVRIEVLKGEILYCDDRRFLYDKAYETIKEFDYFKHRYYDYIGAEAIR
jgi:predicted nucleotidyltransferase